VLQGLAAVAVVPVADGCSGPLTSAAGGAPASAAVGSFAAAAPPWQDLARRLKGRLYLPSTPGYDTARLPYDARYDGTRPAAVARVASDADVAAALAFAREHRVPFSVRSGGHCYAGWSTGTGLVLDVSGLAANKVTGTALVAGAGSRLVDVYQAAARAGRGIPAGSCPTVGLAGLALGGGVGVLTRAWGLTCDAVRAVRIVTADGHVRDVDAHSDPDLFWACRGGGGGSFGVVTRFTLDTHPAPAVSLFYLRFPWSAARDVVAAWQAWAPGADHRAWSTCKLLTTRQGPPQVTVSGTWIGPADAVGTLLAPLLRHAGAAPVVRSVRRRSYLAAMLTEAGCDPADPAACHLPPAGRLTREPFAATSHMPPAPMSSAGIAALVRAVEHCVGTPGLDQAGASLDALGGAVAAVPAAATAFVHRGSPFSVQYTATWRDGARAGAPYDRLVRGMRTTMTPYLGGGAYVNYADAALPGWAQAYYGTNLPRLKKVKAEVDPGRVFTFPQAVPA
jgi:FAD/FMN-containing dehydrogenase